MPYIYDENGNLVEHKGDVSSESFDFGKAMLDYGWAVPAAYGLYKVGEKAIDLYKTKKGGGIDSRRMSKGDFVDVPSREIYEPASPVEEIKQLQHDPVSTVRQKSAAAAEAMNKQADVNTAPPAKGPVQPPVQAQQAVAPVQPPVAPFGSVTGDQDALRRGLLGEQPKILPEGVQPREFPTAAEAVATGQNGTEIAKAAAGEELVKASAEPEIEGSAKPKKGRPAGAKNLTAEARQMQEAAKGINMYRNMFGFQKDDPTSTKSLAAIESTNRLIQEAFQGNIPASRDPFLNPASDVTAAGKKFYSGTPEGYRNAYIPWLEQNLHTLPPETQSHVLSSMTKGQTKDISKIVKGLGLAGAALGAYETAFAKTPQERAMAGANLIGAILPPGMDIGEAGAPTLSPEQRAKQEEFALLGSPYYQTQQAKNLRQAKKVGAGRGIAPPSQYQR